MYSQIKKNRNLHGVRIFYNLKAIFSALLRQPQLDHVVSWALSVFTLITNLLFLTLGSISLVTPPPWNKWWGRSIEFLRAITVEKLYPFKYTLIYSNKRRGAYWIFRVSNAALIRGRRLFKIGPDKESFSFYLTVYFLSVRKFYSNQQNGLLIVTIRLSRHFNKMSLKL